jgi:hypothetical protein
MLFFLRGFTDFGGTARPRVDVSSEPAAVFKCTAFTSQRKAEVARTLQINLPY